MKFQIMNRTNELTPPFRTKLLKLLSIPGEQLILGYGYLDHNMINDEFIKNMQVGFQNTLYPEVIIIGKHSSNSTCNLNSYIQACDKIKKNIPNVNIRLLIAKKENYHKKVAIKSSKSYNGDIIANVCIIGSSNLTGPTFSCVNICDNFNQEVDIVFWRDIPFEEIQGIRDSELENDDLQLNFGVDIQAYWYLEKIYDDIHNRTDFIQCYPARAKDRSMPINVLLNNYNIIKNDQSLDEKGRKFLEKWYDRFFIIIHSKTIDELHDYFLKDDKKDDYLLITLRNNYIFNRQRISDYLNDILTNHEPPF